jgi:hypothetical protein
LEDDMTEFVDSDDSQIGYEVTGLTAAAEEIIAARPEQLDHPGPPRRGARFTGHNRLPNGFEYEVTCVVTEADRPRAFAGWSWMTAVTLSARLAVAVPDRPALRRRQPGPAPLRPRPGRQLPADSRSEDAESGRRDHRRQAGPAAIQHEHHPARDEGSCRIRSPAQSNARQRT